MMGTTLQRRIGVRAPEHIRNIAELFDAGQTVFQIARTINSSPVEVLDVLNRFYLVPIRIDDVILTLWELEQRINKLEGK